jgi:hypothetical protein
MRLWGQIFNLDNGGEIEGKAKKDRALGKKKQRFKESIFKNKDLTPILPPAPFWTGSLTGATSWKRMGKVTDCDRPGKDLTGNPHHGRTQTHKKRTNNLTGNLKPLYL